MKVTVFPRVSKAVSVAPSGRPAKVPLMKKVLVASTMVKLSPIFTPAATLVILRIALDKVTPPAVPPVAINKSDAVLVVPISTAKVVCGLRTILPVVKVPGLFPGASVPELKVTLPRVPLPPKVPPFTANVPKLKLSLTFKVPAFKLISQVPLATLLSVRLPFPLRVNNPPIWTVSRNSLLVPKARLITALFKITGAVTFKGPPDINVPLLT